MGHIQDAFTEAIISHEALPLPRRIAVVRAIGKLIWIQNDLLARWHIDEHDEPGSAPPSNSKDPFHDQLGARAGKDLDSRQHDGTNKTSLGRIRQHSDDSYDSFKSSSPSGCPFSGMMLDDQRAELRGASRPVSRLHSPTEAPSSG